jgi:hypothetical protein
MDGGGMQLGLVFLQSKGMGARGGGGNTPSSFRWKGLFGILKSGRGVDWYRSTLKPLLMLG